MNYRKDKYGNNLSILGYGCMRFSRAAGKIDIDKAEQEIMAAFRNGVNYYDTCTLAAKLHWGKSWSVITSGNRLPLRLSCPTT